MCFSLCTILLVYYFMQSYAPSNRISLSYHSGFLIVFEFLICITLLLDIFSNIVINSIVVIHCEQAWGLCSDSYLLLRYALGNHRYCHHRIDINNKGIWNTHFNGIMRWVGSYSYVDMAANSAVSPDDQVSPGHNPLFYQFLSLRNFLFVFCIIYQKHSPSSPSASTISQFPVVLPSLPFPVSSTNMSNHSPLPCY